MQTVKKMVRKVIPRPVETPPAPVESAESAYSAICSLYDQARPPTQRLIELGIDAVERAMRDVEVAGSVWPGQELKLIGGLMLAMRPKVVAVIGEGNSRASEVIRRYLPDGGKISDEMEEVEFVLVNGPGDGKFEQHVLQRVEDLQFEKAPIVMLNDTRKWEMLRYCREIRYPTLDMTSFGRWTGTMLVELTR